MVAGKGHAGVARPTEDEAEFLELWPSSLEQPLFIKKARFVLNYEYTMGFRKQIQHQ